MLVLLNHNEGSDFPAGINSRVEPVIDIRTDGFIFLFSHPVSVVTCTMELAFLSDSRESQLPLVLLSTQSSCSNAYNSMFGGSFNVIDTPIGDPHNVF